MNRLKSLLKSIGVLIGLWLALTVITLASAQAAHAVAVTIALAAFLALLRPMPKLGIGNRAFATVLLLVVGLPISMATQSLVVEQRETRLAGLKLTDSAAYLAEL